MKDQETEILMLKVASEEVLIIKKTEEMSADLL